MQLLIPEILKMADDAKTRQEKINILRKHDSMILRGMLQLNYNEQKFNLPEGEPPFKKETDLPAGMASSNLYVEARRLYIWLDPNTNLPKAKREQLFIELLEGVHWTEAEMLCLIKDKKLTEKYKTLKYDLVFETFPGLLPPQVKEEVVPEKKPEKRGPGRPRKSSVSV